MLFLTQSIFSVSEFLSQTYNLFFSLGIVFIILGLLFVKLRKPQKKWLLYHKSMMTTGALILLIGLIFLIKNYNNTLANLLFILSLLAILVNLTVGGLMIKKNKNPPNLRNYHPWIGRFAISLIIIAALIAILQ